MKLNIECSNLNDFSKCTSLEEVGVLTLLDTFNNKGVTPLKVVFPIGVHENTLSLITKLSKQGLFEITKTNENDSLVINIINKPAKVKLENLSTNKKIQITFKLNDLKYKTVMSNSQDAKSFKYNLVNVCYQNYEMPEVLNFEINSQDDYLNMLSVVTPFELIIFNEKRLTVKDFEQVYDLIQDYDFDIPMLNFAIDYAITTSQYNNLSYEFVRILLDSWKKHKIEKVSQAVELIKLQKEQGSRRGSKFVDPTYNQEINVTSENIENININKLFVEDGSFE